jgi:hypothetical protein
MSVAKSYFTFSEVINVMERGHRAPRRADAIDTLRPILGWAAFTQPRGARPAWAELRSNSGCASLCATPELEPAGQAEDQAVARPVLGERDSPLIRRLPCFCLMLMGFNVDNV